MSQQVTRMRARLQGLIIALGACGLELATAAVPPAAVTTIGTGAVTGVYYAAGGAICRLVNKDRPRHGQRCLVESTAGSVANLEGVRDGEFDFAVVQSDTQFAAVQGVNAFDHRPDADLRAVFSLHTEPLTVLVRRDARVRQLSQLRGQRLNVGNPGSGTRALMDELLPAVGWRASDRRRSSELTADQHGAALCDGRIDAFGYVVGHPSANVQEPILTCGARLLPIEGPVVDRLLREHPHYVRAQIPGGLYTAHPRPTPSYGVVATLVTSSRVPAQTVYAVVKAVFDHFAEFRQQHPVLGLLEPQLMLRAGLTAPLHPGAVRYYQERGWLPLP